jgi:hypothetical protein
VVASAAYISRRVAMRCGFDQGPPGTRLEVLAVKARPPMRPFATDNRMLGDDC